MADWTIYTGHSGLQNGNFTFFIFFYQVWSPLFCGCFPPKLGNLLCSRTPFCTQIKFHRYLQNKHCALLMLQSLPSMYTYHGIILTSTCPYVRGRTCKKKKKKKLSNRVPETTTTLSRGRSFALAWPYVRGRTWKPKKNKKKKTNKKKPFKQPHRPVLRSRKRRLDCGIVFIYKCA